MLTFSNTAGSSWGSDWGDMPSLVRNDGRIEIAMPANVIQYFWLPLENDGVIALRGGKLEATTKFNQTPDGVLDAELRQGEQGDESSSISLSPTTGRLAGTLQLRVPDGETPTAGQSWRILRAWGQPGSFSRILGADSVPGIRLDAASDGGGVLVTAEEAQAAQANLDVEQQSVSAQPGGDLYKFSVRNLGDAVAPDVRLVDQLPEDLDLVSASWGSGPCADRGDAAVCSIGRLAPGDEALVEVVARPLDSEPGDQTVEVSSTVPDSDPAENVLRVASLGAPVDEGDRPASEQGSELPDAAPPAVTPPAEELDEASDRPTIRRRTLHVRRGSLLVLRGKRGLTRGAKGADGEPLRFKVIRRSRGSGRVKIRRDGRVRMRAPHRRTTLWLDVVAVDSVGARSAPARIRIRVR